jgi:hypothetical protein
MKSVASVAVGDVPLARAETVTGQMSDPTSQNFPQNQGGRFAIAGGTILALGLLYVLYFFWAALVLRKSRNSEINVVSRNCRNLRISPSGPTTIR